MMAVGFIQQLIQDATHDRFHLFKARTPDANAILK